MRLKALAPAILALQLSVPPLAAAPAPSLALAASDLRIEQFRDGGYHLYVRAKPGLGSVLLTESTKDPSLKADNFAYRALERSSVNAGETRILDGKSLGGSGDLRFLVDSSPEPDSAFGNAFHLFIPWVVAWGYPWSRSGKEFIHDGTFINIRTFSKPFADYSGAFADNPYLIRVSQAASRPPAATPAPVSAPVPAPIPAPAPAPVRVPVRVPAPAPVAAKAVAPAVAPASKAAYKPELYIPETIAAFGALAAASGGELRYASEDGDIVGQIESLLAREKGRSLDLVICLDTTDTMINGLDALKARLPAALARMATDFPALRLGLVAFKDYFEEYLYRRFDFVGDVPSFAAELESLQCGGGRDIPEAVYEALFAAGSEFPWAAQSRLLVLVGDAPPHPLPRGSVDEAAVDEAVRSAGIRIDAVAVPK